MTVAEALSAVSVLSCQADGWVGGRGSEVNNYIYWTFRLGPSVATA